jgi:hypothetical protein
LPQAVDLEPIDVEQHTIGVIPTRCWTEFSPQIE